LAAGLNARTVPPLNYSLPNIDLCNSNREAHSRIAATTKTVLSHSLADTADHLELLDRVSRELVELQLPLTWREDVVTALRRSGALGDGHLRVDSKHHCDFKLFTEHLTDTFAKLSISLYTMSWHPPNHTGNDLDNLLSLLSGIVASYQQKQNGLCSVRARVADLAESSAIC